MSMYKENSVLRILQSFGKISMEEFNSRLKLQKLAYFSQELGADRSFYFLYYHYGPYSTELTRMLYRGVDNDLFSNDIGLNENEKLVSSRIKDLVGSTSDPHKLELFATVWYLLPHCETTSERQQEVIDKIARTKPRFKREEIRKAMDKILKFRENQPLS